MKGDEIKRLFETLPHGASVYLLGIGGCGVSGLAHLLLDLGYRVSGSDLASNEATAELVQRGADIAVGHTVEHLLEAKPSLVVYSSAVPPNNAQLEAARKGAIPVVRRAVALASLFNRQSGVAVAGMHGKTTTSALLAYALDRLGGAPSYAIGASVPQLSRHARWCAEKYFVAEADESDGTLREFVPDYAIVTNVDEEHLDYFQDLTAVCTEFRSFGSQARKLLVYCADDPRLADIFSRHSRAVSYGYNESASYRISNAGPGKFSLSRKGAALGSWQIALLGEKNVLNAAAAVALLMELGFDATRIAGAIRDFKGAARRQQEIFNDGRIRIFDDYGHHPVEIEATLAALRTLNPKRLLVAFQPHRFTRTKQLLKEFAGCFRGADKLWVTGIYAASEPPIPGITGERLADEIRGTGQDTHYVPRLDELPQEIYRALTPGDLVLFIGAGDITMAAAKLRKDLMTSENDLEAKLTARLSARAVVRRNEPLARRTTLRVGGPADWYVEPASEADLAEVLRFCKDQGMPILILGRGSNLLVRDKGVRGMVVCLAQPCFSELQIQGEHLLCGAGVKLKTLAVEARRNGLTGLEFLEGIPGSVGGALRMNAGAMGSWMFEVVETIRFMDYSGEIHERRASEIYVEYRGCPLFRDHIALSAALKAEAAAREAIAERMKRFSEKRWDSQPAAPSAGCIFKNTVTVPAGKLIDELGLKGTRVGGAVVSDLHGNFIINDGSATAQDVLNLIEIIKQRARAARGIDLETEVQIIGE